MSNDVSDIVERLRDPAREGGGDAYEAADEIERLRVEAKALRETLEWIACQIGFATDDAILNRLNAVL